eukprot:4030566-Pyramimonas_sp.AAC.1
MQANAKRGASPSSVATPIEDEIATKMRGDDGDVDQLEITDKDKTSLEFIYETEALSTQWGGGYGLWVLLWAMGS